MVHLLHHRESLALFHNKYLAQYCSAKHFDLSHCKLFLCMKKNCLLCLYCFRTKSKRKLKTKKKMDLTQFSFRELWTYYYTSQIISTSNTLATRLSVRLSACLSVCLPITRTLCFSCNIFKFLPATCLR